MVPNVQEAPLSMTANLGVGGIRLADIRFAMQGALLFRGLNSGAAPRRQV